MKYQISE